MSKRNDDPRDLNGDGEVSKAEKEYYDRVTPDPLDAKELAQKYGFALRVLRSNPELWSLFQKALGEAKKGKEGAQWTPDRFTAELQNTKWWSENNEYARKAWAAQKIGGADWRTSVQNAEEVIKRRAIGVGLRLSDNNLRQLAVRYLYEGWEDSRRSGLLDAALSEYVGKNDANPGNVSLNADLQTLAFNYGVDLPDGWLDKTNKEILRGTMTEDLAIQWIKDQAKSKYKPIAGQIDSGQTTREALSQYMSTVSDLLELGGIDKVDLNDPLMKKALGSNGPGEEMMTVYDFEKAVRRDSRWAKTKNGQQSTVNLAQDFLKNLGF